VFHVEHGWREPEFGDCSGHVGARDEDLRGAARQALEHTALVVAVEFGGEIVEREDRLVAGDRRMEVCLREQGRQGGEFGLAA